MAKVLVVEDDRDNLDVLGRTLEKGGHVIVRAENGWEALLALDAHHVDVIVLDVMMPGMNGNAFLRIIRNDQRRKAVPVIILSALASGELLKSTVELGVQAWFTKSEYTAADLLDAVQRLSQGMPAAHQPAATDNRWQSAPWVNN